ncbi:transcriptional regulator [Arthrobacter sp. SW1]|uniref:ArsR/SmtB family transcription factor n=1 Tax=Arthrobacter sp. SW1 TaxID=1920889 RepID=UPI000877E279|nr:metalloregulator ArsR/SmtB family transcription factor [Arthrobacter sp. SW1]OFI37223.1 transcriptional regulator [Arthrobacter sp. SW1]
MVTDDVFAVIAEATRRDILVSLRSGDKAVGELVQELEASQPTISKHLKVLREADLVSMRAQGQKRYYALNPKPLAGIASWLETFDVGTASGAAPAAPAAQRRKGLAKAAAQPAAVAGSAAQGARPAAAVHATQPAQETGVPVPAALDDTVPQQIGRTVGRAATKAADLLSKLPELPKFGRKK